jgi:hypothetical protein
MDTNSLNSIYNGFDYISSSIADPYHHDADTDTGPLFHHHSHKIPTFYFDANPVSTLHFHVGCVSCSSWRWCQFATIGIQTHHGSIANVRGPFRASKALEFWIQLLIMMRIRILFFNLMRIRTRKTDIKWRHEVYAWKENKFRKWGEESCKIFRIWTQLLIILFKPANKPYNIWKFMFRYSRLRRNYEM